MMWWRGRVLFLTFWQSAANGSIPPIVSNAAPATGAPSCVHEGLNAVTRYFLCRKRDAIETLARLLMRKKRQLQSLCR